MERAPPAGLGDNRSLVGSAVGVCCARWAPVAKCLADGALCIMVAGQRFKPEVVNLIIIAQAGVLANIAAITNCCLLIDHNKTQYLGRAVRHRRLPGRSIQPREPMETACLYT